MRPRSFASVVSFVALATAALLMSACQTVTPEPDLPDEVTEAQVPPVPDPEPAEEPAAEELAVEEPIAEEPVTEEPVAEGPAPATASDCAGGVIKDDGSVDSGYGYVPSAKMGVYLQAFQADEFPSRELSEVCVCWLRTREDNDVEFEVVFYEDNQGRPTNQPYAKVKSIATEVPEDVENAGRFYSVDVSGVTLAEGTSYIGVHWNPSASRFFFVCNDRSEETEITTVYSAEDRAPAWSNIKNSRDPIFKPHRAILLRAKSVE